MILLQSQKQKLLDLVNGESIMSISENDAPWNNSTKQELAERNKTLINTAIIKYKNETSVTISKRNRISLTWY
jgi:hypothetical protein